MMYIPLVFPDRLVTRNTERGSFDSTFLYPPQLLKKFQSYYCIHCLFSASRRVHGGHSPHKT